MKDEVLADMTGHLGQALLSRDEMLVIVESCTGGGLAELVTRVPGSSNWFERAYVAYSNDAKRENVGVSVDALESYGAVSEEVAVQMAQGGLVNSHAQLAVAVTGIAGPNGGMPDKPVGTVCFAWVYGEVARSATSLFKGGRQDIRQQSCILALQGCLDILAC